MGIDSERFVSALPQGAYCVECGDTLEDPVEIIECGHLLCYECWAATKCGRCDENDVQAVCPFCGVPFDVTNVRKSSLTWNLIQNMDVYCANKESGCESIYKYTYDKLHRQKCRFDGENTDMTCDEDGDAVIDKCATCGTPEYEGKHDCTAELLRKLRRQNIQITNLELENSKMALKLATRGSKSDDGGGGGGGGGGYLESLKFNKEIRELRSKLALVQGEMGRSKVEVRFCHSFIIFYVRPLVRSYHIFIRI